MAVLSRLDPSDQTEADHARGERSSHLQLFADWRAVEPARVVSLVLCAGSEAAPIPFAVLGLSNTGQAGVASAALLARDHFKFKRHLMATCLLIRDRMPPFCVEHGIHRIEARTPAPACFCVAAVLPLKLICTATAVRVAPFFVNSPGSIQI